VKARKAAAAASDDEEEREEPAKELAQKFRIKGWAYPGN